MTERILCAACWYQDGQKRQHQPSNIDSGLVICGHRHHNVLQVAKETSLSKEIIRNNCVEGFVTNKNRFVNRQEAFQIADVAEQINLNELRRRGVYQRWFEYDTTLELYSEDLY